MLPPNRNPNLGLYLLSLPYTTSTIPTNIIHYLISKPLKNPIFFLIKPTQFPPLIQLLCHFLNPTIPQSLFPKPKPFNSIQNFHMSKYAYEGKNPLSLIPMMPCF